MRVVLLGLPASGKGTQARLLARRFDLPLIGAGELLRENVRRQTPLGQKVAPYLERGDLPPHEIVSALVCDHLEGKNTFVLDGFPRLLSQAEALQLYLERIHRPLTIVFYLRLPRELAVKRLTTRQICVACKASLLSREKEVCSFCGGKKFEQRADDTTDAILKRLATQEEALLPLLDYYTQRSLLHTIDACQDEMEVFESIAARLANKGGFSQA
jgi:adenylate kinase